MKHARISAPPSLARRIWENFVLGVIYLAFGAFMLGCLLHDMDMDRKEDRLKQRVQDIILQGHR